MSGAVPVSLTLGELQSFIEVPFESNDPLYAVEAQLFDFEGTTGHALKVQDWTKKVWLYFEPHLPITEEWFSRDPAYALAELAALTPTTFDRFEFDVQPTSAHLDVAFTDVDGNRFEVSVDSQDEKPVKPVFTPTPPGVTPANLRLLHMTDFRFLPTSRTVISASLAGTKLSPANLQVPGIGAEIPSRSSTRVCTGLTLGAINGADCPVGSDRIENRHGWFVVTGGPEFGPQSDSGSFVIEGPLGAVTTGNWMLRSTEGNDAAGFIAELTDVSQSWRPPLTRPLDVVFWVVRLVRRRGEQWRWSGRFTRDSTATSGWSQVGRWDH